MTSGTRWYVVHTHPQHESRADVNLRRQGFSTYFPCYLRTRRHARRTDAVTRALFPRYLFVELDLARDRWHSIHSTYGVCSLVAAGEEPVPVSPEIVEEIRAREDAEGFVTIGLAAGLGLGSRIRLVDGLFADASGTIEWIAGERRVAVLLQLLGREVRVSVPATLVAPA